MSKDETVSRQAAAEAVAREYLSAWAASDVDRVAALLAPDFVSEYPFHESGSVDPSVLRRVQGREAYLAYARRDLPTVRYTYIEPSFRPTADGRSVYVETGCRVEVPGTTSPSPELVYRNTLLYRMDIENGLITHFVTWHNPVAALVFHRERKLPTQEEIDKLGHP